MPGIAYAIASARKRGIGWGGGTGGGGEAPDILYLLAPLSSIKHLVALDVTCFSEHNLPGTGAIATENYSVQKTVFSECFDVTPLGPPKAGLTRLPCFRCH